MKNLCLNEKSCLPCKGGMPSLNEDSRNKLLAQLESGWGLNTDGHLYKDFLFKNFRYAMELANKIATIAEKEKHHPNLFITWGKCGVEIWTHAIDGLTENDFILAAKIDVAFKI